jgi:hypothetical protein
MAGRFGNKTRSWSTFDELWQSGYRGLVHIRNRIAGAATWYNVPFERVLWTLHNVCKLSQPIESLYYAEMAPTAETIVQGEVMRGLNGLELTCSFVVAPMREALLRETKIAQGLRATMVLSHFLDPGDCDWIQELLAEYPGHVIEWSHYRIPCGTLNRRCIIWEVRGGY